MHKNLNFILNALRKVADIPQNAHIDLILLDRMEAYKLNKKYKSKFRVPDILSFSYFDDKTSYQLHSSNDGASMSSFPMGQICICIPEIKSRISKYPLMHFNHYLIKLLCHGMAHLKGYDHETFTDFQKMNHFENECKRKFYLQHRLIVKNQKLVILPLFPSLSSLDHLVTIDHIQMNK